MNSLRIALLCPNELGPARDLGVQLAARGHRPRLITTHRGLPQTSYEAGLVVTRNWHTREARLERRGFERDLGQVPSSYLSLLRGTAQLAHAFHAPDALAAARWAHGRTRPVVLSLPEVPSRSWLVARRLRLESVLRALRGGQTIVTESRFAADALVSSLGLASQVIYPGVDLEHFAPGAQRSPTPTILCLGLTAKASRSLGAAIAQMRTSVRLILGPDDDPGGRAANGSAPAAKLGVAAFRGAWLTVLLSRYGAFPLPLVESLACGTPVLAWNGGANPEVINRPEVGLLTSAQEPAELGRAILTGLELIEDPQTTQLCRAHAEEFSITRHVDAHEALYAELLDRRSGADVPPLPCSHRSVSQARSVGGAGT